MRFIGLLLLAPLMVAAAMEPRAEEGVAVAVEEPVEARDAALEPEPDRQICPLSRCRCQPTVRRGEYCGSCRNARGYIVTIGRIYNHKYSCYPGGSCCDLGAAPQCFTTQPRCGLIYSE